MPRFLMSFALWICSCGALADVWVSTQLQLHKLSPDLTGIVLSVPSAPVHHLAVDPRDKAVWSLTSSGLEKRSSAGSLLLQSDLRSLGVEGTALLALDGRDGSIWLGEGGGSAAAQNKSIVHLSDQGAVLARMASPGQLASMQVGPDQQLWLMGDRKIFSYTRDGIPSGELDLAPLVAGEPRMFAVDALGAWIWVSGERRLLRVDIAGGVPPQLIALPAPPVALANDIVDSRLYALSASAIFPVDETGAVGTAVPISGRGLGAMAFDPVTRKALVAANEGVFVLASGDGSVRLTPTSAAVVRIGVEPARIAISARIQSPAAGLLSNVLTVPVIAQLAWDCSGGPCTPDASVDAGASVSVALDDSAPMPLAYDPGSRTFRGSMTFLSDGVHQIHVTASHPFAAPSSAQSTITIDTVPPSLLDLQPSSPHVTNASSIAISGRISERGQVLLDGIPLSLDADGTFSAPRPLNEGHNNFSLEARDLAGNRYATSVVVSRDSQPPQFVDVVPGDGTATNAPTITVVGSVNEASTITLTAGSTVLGATGTGFSFPVALANGLNTIELVARDAAGNTSSLTLRISRVGAVDIQVTSPADGSTTSQERIPVRGRVTAAGNPAVKVNGALAESFGEEFVAYVLLQPGNNVVAIEAVSGGAVVATRSLTVSFVPGDVFTPSLSPDVVYAPGIVYIDVPAGSTASIDFEGDGFVDESGAGPRRFERWIHEPGIYQARVTASTAGQSRESVLPYVVRQVSSQDAMLRGIVEAMRARLRAGDIPGAMAYFTAAAAARYRPAFEQLSSSLPAVADQLGTVVEGKFAGDVAEYLVVQELNGDRQGFFIYLIREADGVWRISQL